MGRAVLIAARDTDDQLRVDDMGVAGHGAGHHPGHGSAVLLRARRPAEARRRRLGGQVEPQAGDDPQRPGSRDGHGGHLSPALRQRIAGVAPLRHLGVHGHVPELPVPSLQCCRQHHARQGTVHESQRHAGTRQQCLQHIWPRRGGCPPRRRGHHRYPRIRHHQLYSRHSRGPCRIHPPANVQVSGDGERQPPRGQPLRVQVHTRPAKPTRTPTGVLLPAYAIP